MKRLLCSIFSLLALLSYHAQAQQDPRLLTIDRIYGSGEFRSDYQPPVSWIEKGAAYIIIERNEDRENELIKYSSAKDDRSVFVSAAQLTPADGTPLSIEDFTLSADESKVLIFTNSQRVWRSNTKGDYWVYDFTSGKLSQIGQQFPASSLMFAKFSGDNQYVAYVKDFNLYKEDFSTGEITPLTDDGTGEIINGTFDWVYEEEFGCRDGFRWSPDASKIAYWQLDASDIGVFNMINNTDSVYSQIVPVQYPKVGQDPSSAKIGLVDTRTGTTTWIALEVSTVQNYVPAIQWVSADQLLIQQLNRKQNHLKVWSYQPSTQALKVIYEEKEETWVDMQYPDATSSHWGDNDLKFVDGGQSFVKMVEDDWRNAYKISLTSGAKTLLSPGTYDVASIAGTSKNALYYHASPDHTAQRYLYQTDLKGRKKDARLTPADFAGMNNYNISPNGRYALHSHSSALQPTTVRLISLPDHQVIRTLVSNEAYQTKIAGLELPTVDFFEVTTAEGTMVHGRAIKPADFDENKAYPTIIHVYGEPWGQVATDSWINLWNVMLAQQGYLIIDIDPRGTPCLKGSEWRKSIYRQIGRVNIRDLGQATREIAKFSYVDASRIGVWGWSGGGSSTLGLMFQFPDVFSTGVSVAPVANQLTYDNIYQERYMGLPQENKEDFVAGSPITHAKGLQGKLLLIHGTADDNVHYQNSEMLINELIRQNKQFDMMAYPNRSHGIYEGRNTRRHLYTLITNYFLEHLPVE